MDRKKLIEKFCENCNFFMVSYNKKKGLGKILNNDGIKEIDLNCNEIFRSLKYKNNDLLFVHTLKPLDNVVQNPLSLLIDSLKEIRIIELIYPDTFTYVFDGVFINILGIISSSDVSINGTLTRYGGKENFFKVLNNHLLNIRKLKHEKTPNYNLLDEKKEIKKTILSVGSINVFNNLYCVVIKPSMSSFEVLRNSKRCNSVSEEIKVFDLKFWRKEINPDFISNTRFKSVTKNISIDDGFKFYPPCIKNIMALKTKGNLNRYRLINFLLSCHSQKDAKFVYNSVLSKKELKHVTEGNCSNQWTYILNNFKKYSCPTCNQLLSFCDKKNCSLSHPLELIQKKIDENEKREHG